MISRDVQEKLAGHAYVDSGFRERLFADPQSAAKEIGIYLSDDDAKLISAVDKDKIDAAVRQANEAFGPRKFDW